MTAARSWWVTKVQSTRDKKKVSPCNICDRAFKSLPTPNQHKIWQPLYHVFDYKGRGKMFKTSNSINRHKKIVYGKPHHRKNVGNFFMWGKDHHCDDHPQSQSDEGGGENEVGSGQLQEEGILYHPNWKVIVLFF